MHKIFGVLKKRCARVSASVKDAHSIKEPTSHLKFWLHAKPLLTLSTELSDTNDVDPMKRSQKESHLWIQKNWCQINTENRHRCAYHCHLRTISNISQQSLSSKPNHTLMSFYVNLPTHEFILFILLHNIMKWLDNKRTKSLQSLICCNL